MHAVTAQAAFSNELVALTGHYSQALLKTLQAEMKAWHSLAGHPISSGTEWKGIL